MDVRTEEAKTTGILHMAFDFASMARTFEKAEGGSLLLPASRPASGNARVA